MQFIHADRARAISADSFRNALNTIARADEDGQGAHTYPASMLYSASDFLGISFDALCRVCGTTMAIVENLERQHKTIDAALALRLHDLMTVTHLALRVFEVEAHAVKWLRSDNVTLGGKTPLCAIEAGNDIAAVVRTLHSIASGSVA